MPKRTLDLDTGSKRQRYGYLDPYVNVTGRPALPQIYNWTYLNSETWHHTGASRQKDFPFRLSLNTVEQFMGTLQGVQVGNITPFCLTQMLIERKCYYALLLVEFVNNE